MPPLWLVLLKMVSVTPAPAGTPATVAAAAGGAVTGTATSGATTTLRLALHWVAQSEFAGIYMAQEKGFFARRGLEVQLIQCGVETRSAFELLKEGDVDLATANLADALIENEKGLSLRHLAQYVQRSSLVVAAWRGRGIRQPADLNGRRVSVWRGTGGVPFRLFFRHHGVTPVIRPQYFSINLFLERGVDACSMSDYDEYHQLYLYGINPEELTIFRLSDAGLGFPEDGLYVCEDYFPSHREACLALRDATLEGWEYARTHREEAMEVVRERIRRQHRPANTVLIRRMLDSYCESMFAGPDDPWETGRLGREDYERTVRCLRENGVLKSAPSYDDFTSSAP